MSHPLRVERVVTLAALGAVVVVAAMLALSAFGALFATAATLRAESGYLQAGAQTVASCDASVPATAVAGGCTGQNAAVAVDGVGGQ